MGRNDVVAPLSTSMRKNAKVLRKNKSNRDSFQTYLCQESCEDSHLGGNKEMKTISVDSMSVFCFSSNTNPCVKRHVFF